MRPASRSSLDQSELRAGTPGIRDPARDPRLRRSLFLVSFAHTQARHEGYFRLSGPSPISASHHDRSQPCVRWCQVCPGRDPHAGRVTFQIVSAVQWTRLPERGSPRPSSNACTVAAVHRGARHRPTRDSVGRACMPTAPSTCEARPGTLAVKDGALSRRLPRSSLATPAYSVASNSLALASVAAPELSAAPAPRSALRPPPSPRRRTRSRGAAVREPERRQRAGVLTAYRRTTQLHGRDQRAAGRSPHLSVL